MAQLKTPAYDANWCRLLRVLYWSSRAAVTYAVDGSKPVNDVSHRLTAVCVRVSVSRFVSTLSSPLQSYLSSTLLLLLLLLLSRLNL